MQYLQGPGIDEVLARSVGGASAWYLTDRMGSVRQITNLAGSVLDTITYDPFGGVAAESGPSYGDRYKYTGREYDSTSQLQYSRARFYDATTGRWLSEDPLGFSAGDVNLYRYVWNAPIGYVDPMGTDGGGVGTGGGGGYDPPPGGGGGAGLNWHYAGLWDVASWASGGAGGLGGANGRDGLWLGPDGRGCVRGSAGSSDDGGSILNSLGGGFGTSSAGSGSGDSLWLGPDGRGCVRDSSGRGGRRELPDGCFGGGRDGRDDLWNDDGCNRTPGGGGGPIDDGGGTLSHLGGGFGGAGSGGGPAGLWLGPDGRGCVRGSSGGGGRRELPDGCFGGGRDGRDDFWNDDGCDRTPGGGGPIDNGGGTLSHLGGGMSGAGGAGGRDDLWLGPDGRGCDRTKGGGGPVDPAIEPSGSRECGGGRSSSCCKWDPQVEDVATLAPYPLVLARETWSELASTAEALAAETLAAEAELVGRPELHGSSGPAAAVRGALRGAVGRRRRARRGARPALRLPLDDRGMADLRGQLGRSRRVQRSLRLHAPDGVPVPRHRAAGRPRRAARRGHRRARCRRESTVALVHATAYSDDRQVMVFLAREIEARGLRPVLTGPDHLRWRDGRAVARPARLHGPVDSSSASSPPSGCRTSPAPAAGSTSSPGPRTPVSNPAYALLTQSKRFPLVWDRLAAASHLARLLPETRDPRDVSWRRDDGWVLKPALGGSGTGSASPGATEEREWKSDPQGRALASAPVGGAAAVRGRAVPGAGGSRLPLHGGLHRRRPGRRSLRSRGAPAAHQSPGPGHRRADGDGTRRRPTDER